MGWGLKGQPWSGKESEQEVLPGTATLPHSRQAGLPGRTTQLLWALRWGLLFKILGRVSKAQVGFQELGISTRSSEPVIA